MMADMSVLRVTFVTTLRELTIKDSNVICETTLQVLRVMKFGRVALETLEPVGPIGLYLASWLPQGGWLICIYPIYATRDMFSKANATVCDLQIFI